MSLVATVLSALLAAVFLLSGGRKVVGGESVTHEAIHLQVPLAGYRVIGATEVVAAAGLVIGIVFIPLGVAAAAGLVLLLVGATFAHLRVGDPLTAWVPAAALTFLAAATLTFRIMAA